MDKPIDIVREKDRNLLSGVKLSREKMLEYEKEENERRNRIETEEEREMRYSFGHCAMPYGKGI